MEDENINSEIYKKLVSLGCAYNIMRPRLAADPERFILESLKYYWKYNDIFFMTYSLLKHRISHLIHVNRLVSLAKSSTISNDELVLLIALCNKLAENGDHRYKLAEKKLNRRGLKMHNPPRSEIAKHLIKSWGNEASLLPFGVKVRSFYEADKKKFYTLERQCKESSDPNVMA